MPIRCVEFSGYIGTVGAILVMSIMLAILSLAPLGGFGKVLFKILSIGLSLYASVAFINMLATVTGMRGKCEQGYRSGWPPIRGQPYHRDAQGLRIDDPQKPLFS